jgi:monoamine oxidase
VLGEEVISSQKRSVTFKYMKKEKITIIGAGLSGLVLARLLEKQGYICTILEGRDRPGGRILTIRNRDQAPVEMGATWFGNQHRYVIQLLNELGIEKMDQRMGSHAFYEAVSTAPPQRVELPDQSGTTFRIKGGTDEIISKLIADLKQTTIKYNEPVEGIKDHKDYVEIITPDSNFKTPLVISTLPPKLFADTISIDSSLPQEFQKEAQKTQTWMGESIKIGLTYTSPFWRNEGMASTIMSNAGPMNEFYDHSDANDERFAMKGFMNPAYHAAGAEERKNLAIDQLRKFYGDQASAFITFFEKNWREDPFTYSPYTEEIFPHQNNGADFLKRSYLNGKLFFAGAETSSVSPGYMDGAIDSAYRVADMI